MARVKHNPLLDDHVVYATALIGLAFVHAGDTWGVGKWWSKRRDAGTLLRPSARRLPETRP